MHVCDRDLGPLRFQPRTAEARGLTVRRDDGIPKKVPKGAPDIIKESYDYYRTPRAQHQTSRSVFVFIFTDFPRLMDFNYYAQIEDIAPRPVLFIIGTEAATIFMSKAGFEKAPNQRSGLRFLGRHIIASMMMRLQQRMRLRN
jgi:uncharacterized protein